MFGPSNVVAKLSHQISWTCLGACYATAKHMVLACVPKCIWLHSVSYAVVTEDNFNILPYNHLSHEEDSGTVNRPKQMLKGLGFPFSRTANHFL
jgi:hypothetical protein